MGFSISVDRQFPNVLIKVDRMSQTLSLLPCGYGARAAREVGGNDIRDQGGPFFARSNTASNFFGLSLRLDVSRMKLCTETWDPVLDLVAGGFRAIPALGPVGSWLLSGAHRKWKFKDLVIPCPDTILLEFSRFCDIDAEFFLGTNDVPHPDSQRCLFL